MKQEVSPAIMVIALVVVVAVVAFFGFRTLSSNKGGSLEKSKSSADLARVKAGGTMYVPPAGAPVPGAGGTNTGSPMLGSSPGMPGMMNAPPPNAGGR